MTVIIYHIEEIKGDIEMVEYGRFDNNVITGKLNIKNMNRESVIERFNRGYWRTSEI